MEEIINTGEIDEDSQEELNSSFSLPSPTRPARNDRFLWQRSNDKLDNPNLPFEKSPQNSFDDAETPYEFFKHMLNNDLLDEICLQSNFYASRINPNQPLNLDRLIVMNLSNGLEFLFECRSLKY